MAAKTDAPRCVFRGKLFSGQQDEISNPAVGCTVYDGVNTYFGPATPMGYNVCQMWGIDDVGVFAQVESSTANNLCKSDGTTAFTAVCALEPVHRTLLSRCLIDCGRHTINSPDDALGDVERRMLLCVEYASGLTGDAGGNIWYSAQPVDSQAGDAGTWYKIFDTNCDAIKHFHGGTYVHGKGLYVFTGDTDIQSSILFVSTADLPTLIESPSTWYDTNWLLGEGDRAAWSGTVRTNNILIGNTQTARTVDLVSPDGKVAYYWPDCVVRELQSIIKVDFYDTAVHPCGNYSTLASGLDNTGWYGGVDKRGLVYLTNASTWGTDSLLASQNAYVEIYCIDPQDDSYAKVKQIYRKDFDPTRVGVTPAAQQYYGLESSLFEYGGAMLGRFPRYGLHSLGDTTAYAEFVCGSVPYHKKAGTSYLTNGGFTNGFAGWDIETGANNNILAFTSGSAQFAANDVITGQTSGAVAVARQVGQLVSGAWDGTAIGYVRVDAVNQAAGIFQIGEIVASGEKTATINGMNINDIIDDPTGGNGKVLRVINKSTGLPGYPKYMPTLTAAQKVAIKNGLFNYSCKVYHDSACSDTKTIATVLGYYGSPGAVTLSRAGTYRFVENQWRTMDITGMFGPTATTYQLNFYPDMSSSDNDYTLLYVTDFNLINGGIRDDEVEQLSTPGSRSGALYRGTYLN
ncbi:MAG: hypothetical protein LLF76_02820 [Planctomycetaceae bacterium]|nr:hypothetical protein [Planctomycetaceae bacterium]